MSVVRRRRGGDPTVRLQAVLELPASTEAIPALLAAVDDPSPDVARAALARLPLVAGPAETAYLRERLLDADLVVVREWAAALRTLGDKGATRTAIRGLSAASLSTRMAAAIALGELGDARARGPLTHALADRIAGVRRCALESLAMLGPDERAETACQPLLFDRDAGVRCAAVHALRAIAIDTDRRLRSALRDPSPRVRREVASHTPSLRRATAEMLLMDADPDVRTAAARSLTQRPRRDLLNTLILLLGDDTWEVRHAACRATAVTGGQNAVDSLLPLLADPHPMVSAAALNVLEDICGNGFAAVIGEALSASGVTLRRSLIHALSRCPSVDVIPILAIRIDDPEPDVRLAVVFVLGGLDADQAAPVLSRLLDDVGWRVRCAADGTLRQFARGAP